MKIFFQALLGIDVQRYYRYCYIADIALIAITLTLFQKSPFFGYSFALYV